jgi:hypothetical protein
MVIGGVASSFLGRPRMTQDVDALAILPENQWDAATEAARKFGIVPRIDQAVAFAVDHASRSSIMRNRTLLSM